jgi:hypothetical protein
MVYISNLTKISENFIGILLQSTYSEKDIQKISTLVATLSGDL